MSTWLGDTAAQTYSARKRWDAFNGEVQITPVVGPTNTVSGLYTAFKALVGNKPQYESLEFDPGKGVGTLLIGRVENGPDVYELYSYELFVPPEQHQFFATLTTDERVAVKVAFEDGLNETEAGFAAAGLQNRLFRHLVAGAQLPDEGYILRISRVVSSGSQAAASFVGAGTVQAIPNVGALNPIIGNLPAQEWLKKTPRVMARGRRRSWIIEQEYWGLWKWSVALGGTWLA